MSVSEPLTTYLELRASAPDGGEGAGLSHSSEGLVLLHVLELAAPGEPRGGVTLVHGAGDHGARYLDAARSLAEADLAVALPDLRGHGRSEGARGHSAGLREVQRDLTSIQEHLAYRLPVAPKVLVGQGLGALYTAHYALEHPGALAGLVLLSPTWEPRFETPAPKGLLKAFKKVGPETPGRVLREPADLTGDPAALAAWKADDLVHDVITLRAAEEALRCAAVCRGNLERADCPVLVLHGSADPLAPAGSTQAGGAVEVEVVERGRHDLLHDTHAARTLARLRDWIVARL
ncbi:MAG TPA: alpha/beta fold hydrolase [Planctomycetota bacterium]|nr:alpha/beta fold hydrolase [Planctomycetota bacterium]